MWDHDCNLPQSFCSSYIPHPEKIEMQIFWMWHDASVMANKSVNTSLSLVNFRIAEQKDDHLTHQKNITSAKKFHQSVSLEIIDFLLQIYDFT